MVCLGIKVGAPKAYMKVGDMLFLGTWSKVAEIQYNKYEKEAPPFPLLEQDREFQLGGVNHNHQEVQVWLRNSCGATINHPRLRSPRFLSWSYAECHNSPTNENLAKLFHELALLLPINNMDYIMARLNVVEHDFRTMKQNVFCGASEVSC